MTYIQLLPDWPRLTWDTQALAGVLAAVRHKQGRHLGRMQALGFDVQVEAAVASLTEDVVKSWAIEGEQLDPDEVRSSIAMKLGLDAGGLKRPGREVEGIVEMMLDATRGAAAPLTAERLYGWHAALFPTGRSGVERITVGAWREPGGGPMRVVSGPIGREHVHFEAPDATRLDAEMRGFLDWFNAPSNEDPVLRAGVAHLWFITIHPFDDGNGRIARALTDMLLARADETDQRYYSMSSAIEAERSEYYRQLESAQRGGLDITGWLLWFLACLDRTLDQSSAMLESVLHKALMWERINRRPVNDRQAKVINKMLGDFEGFLTSSKYARMTKCSHDTALRDIKGLLRRGILIKNPGGGRSTSYRLGRPDDVGE